MPRARLDRVYRKQLFEKDGLRLWLSARGHKSPDGAILELERRKKGTAGSWEPLWSGILSIEENAVSIDRWKP